MRLDQFERATAGLYAFCSYPMRVTTNQGGGYELGVGVTQSNCQTQNLRGLVATFKAYEASKMGIPFTALKVVLLACERSNCITCIEPLCGPYEGEKFTVWNGANGAYRREYSGGAILELAVTRACEEI